MAELIKIRTYSTRGVHQIPDPTYGKTSIIEGGKDLPFEIKRVFYIFESSGVKRAGHRLKSTIQALICIHGEYEVFTNDGETKRTYTLKSPDECLIVDTKDWHTMEGKTKDSVLLVISNNHYDVNEYIDEEYPN